MKISRAKPSSPPPITWTRDRSAPLTADEWARLLPWLGVRGEPATDSDFAAIERRVLVLGLPPIPGAAYEPPLPPRARPPRRSRAQPDRPELGDSDADRLAEQLSAQGWLRLQDSDLIAADASGPNPIAQISSFWTRTDETQGYPRVRPEPWIRRRDTGANPGAPTAGPRSETIGDIERVATTDDDGNLEVTAVDSITSDDLPGIVAETLHQLDAFATYSTDQIADALSRALGNYSTPDDFNGSGFDAASDDPRQLSFAGMNTSRVSNRPDPAFATWGYAPDKPRAAARARLTPGISYSPPPRQVAARPGAGSDRVQRGITEAYKGLQRVKAVYDKATQVPRGYPSGGKPQPYDIGEYTPPAPDVAAPDIGYDAFDFMNTEGALIGDAEALAALDELNQSALAGFLQAEGGELAIIGDALASGELQTIGELATLTSEAAAALGGDALASFAGDAIAEFAADGVASLVAESAVAAGAEIGLGALIPYVGWVIAAFAAAKAAGLIGNGGPARGTGYHIVGSFGPEGFDGTVFGMSRNSRDNFEFPLVPQWRWRDAFSEAGAAPYAAKGTSARVPINVYVGMDESKFVPTVVAAIRRNAPSAG